MLGPVAADAEVGGLERLEFLGEDLGTSSAPMALASPSVGYRVAQEKDIDIAFLGNLDKRVVPLLVFLDRLDRRVFRLIICPGDPTRQDQQSQGNQAANQGATCHSFSHVVFLSGRW